MNEYLPTKTNLMKLQDSIKLSKQGQELLERKRMILVKEKEKYQEKAKALREEVNILFNEAYTLLQEANLDMGMEEIELISRYIQVENSIDIKYKIVMGVEIPSIVWQEKEKNELVNYDFYTTTISFDKTVLKFNEVKYKLFILTELENTIKRLDIGIQKVQTRSNALQNVVIPEQAQNEKKIQSALEEKEREEFARLKVIKKGNL